ncbi:hypothetical protein, partial [Streptomyces brasiliscabiei]|uniref:hypothetical protein n=1 Tax=Streptomyces brasiliscabiei TaxID=2736302 RepID=UPI003015244B
MSHPDATVFSASWTVVQNGRLCQAGMMPRKRSISHADASEWLAVLLDHSFTVKRIAAATRLDLLGIAHDATAYPDDIP